MVLAKRGTSWSSGNTATGSYGTAGSSFYGGDNTNLSSSMPSSSFGQRSAIARQSSIATSAPSIHERYRQMPPMGQQYTQPRSNSLHINRGNEEYSPSSSSAIPRNPYNKNRTQPIWPRIYFTIALALVVLPWANQFRLRRQVYSIKREIEAMNKKHSKALNKINQYTSDIRDFDNEIRSHEKNNTILLKDIRESGNVIVPNDSNYGDLEKKENVLFKKIDSLKDAIQQISRRSVETDYGPGPHKVEITLKLDGDYNYNNKFVVEMAPLSLMPHSVHHFLKMVSKKLWNGCAFVHRDSHSHVLQATTLSVVSSERVFDKFEAATLTNLAFSEYSPEYPHLAYTVGFSGRPGGPDFYVNTIDNTRNHGPQEEHEVDEGESCFGTVISGRDVLDSIILRDSREGTLRVVEIVDMRLLKERTTITI